MSYIDKNPSITTGDKKYDEVKRYGQRERKLMSDMEKQRQVTNGIDIWDERSRKVLHKVGITRQMKEVLFKRLKKEEGKLMNELMEQIDILEKTKSNMTHLKHSLKRVHNDIRKGFDDDVTIKMSFRTKKSKNIPYVKCRVWWSGNSNDTRGQREINIGSISKIIDTINGYIESKDEDFPKNKLSEDLKTLTWEEFKENKKLMKLLRLISKPMFKGYLITKLYSKRTLGYRIRTKDNTGVSKYFDGKLLNGVDKSHLDQREIEDILSKQKEVHGDSPWYKEIMNMNPYK